MQGNVADLTVVSAHFVNGQKNPYIAFEYNDLHLRTVVLKSQGQNPVWNQDFELKPLKAPNELFVQAFGKTFLHDQFIGETGIVNLKELNLGKNRVELALIDRSGNDKGTVILDITIKNDRFVKSQETSESED